MVARPEEDGPRRVGLHADRAQDAVLERLLLALDLHERAGWRPSRVLRPEGAAASSSSRARFGGLSRVSAPVSASITGTLVRRSSSFSTRTRRALILSDALA